MVVKELTESEFGEFTKEGMVLIDFFADWCMPCLTMFPIIEDLTEKFKGKIKFGKLDVQENQKLAQKYEISSIPNFILFKDGEIIDKFAGAMSSEDFEEQLQKHL